MVTKKSKRKKAVSAERKRYLRRKAWIDKWGTNSILQQPHLELQNMKRNCRADGSVEPRTSTSSGLMTGTTNPVNVCNKQQDATPCRPQECDCPASTTLQILREMWQSGKGCDIVLEAKDGTCITAHKVLLLAKSSYFMSLYNLGHPLEVFTFPTVKLDSLKVIVGHMYGDELFLTAENYQEILHLATKLGIHELVSVCRQFAAAQFSQPTKQWQQGDQLNKNNSHVPCGSGSLTSAHINVCASSSGKRQETNAHYCSLPLDIISLPDREDLVHMKEVLEKECTKRMHDECPETRYQSDMAEDEMCCHCQESDIDIEVSRAADGLTKPLSFLPERSSITEVEHPQVTLPFTSNISTLHPVQNKLRSSSSAMSAIPDQQCSGETRRSMPYNSVSLSAENSSLKKYELTYGNEFITIKPASFTKRTTTKSVEKRRKISNVSKPRISERDGKSLPISVSKSVEGNQNTSEVPNLISNVMDCSKVALQTVEQTSVIKLPADSNSDHIRPFQPRSLFQTPKKQTTEPPVDDSFISPVNSLQLSTSEMFIHMDCFTAERALNSTENTRGEQSNRESNMQNVSSKAYESNSVDNLKKEPVSPRCATDVAAVICPVLVDQQVASVLQEPIKSEQGYSLDNMANMSSAYHKKENKTFPLEYKTAAPPCSTEHLNQNEILMKHFKRNTKFHVDDLLGRLLDAKQTEEVSEKKPLLGKNKAKKSMGKKKKGKISEGNSSQGNSKTTYFAEPVICFVCGDTFTVRSQLDYHMKLHGQEFDMKVSCKLEEELQLPGTPTLHVDTPSVVFLGECKPTVCEHTKKLNESTKCKAKKRYFVASEENEKTITGKEVHKKIGYLHPFLCNECGRKSKSAKNHAKHMQAHTRERPYICSDCGKAFSVKHNLDVHQRIHTGEKPYQCLLCDTPFMYTVTLASHLKSVHGVGDGIHWKQTVCDWDKIK